MISCNISFLDLDCFDGFFKRCNLSAVYFLAKIFTNSSSSITGKDIAKTTIQSFLDKATVPKMLQKNSTYKIIKYKAVDKRIAPIKSGFTKIPTVSKLFSSLKAFTASH